MMFCRGSLWLTKKNGLGKCSLAENQGTLIVCKLSCSQYPERLMSYGNVQALARKHFEEIVTL